VTSTLTDDVLGDYEEYEPRDETPDPLHTERDLPGNENGDHTTRFLDADIGDFIKRPKTAIAREYEKKAQALLNAGMRVTIKTPGTLPDAAAIIAYGDEVAAAAGELAESSEWTRKAIDLIAVPGDPRVLFALALIPLASQLVRNHHDAFTMRSAALVADGAPPMTRKEKRAARKIKRAARPGVRVGYGRWKVKIPFTVEMFGSGAAKYAMSQSVDPRALTESVFANPAIAKALKKRGIDIGR